MVGVTRWHQYIIVYFDNIGDDQTRRFDETLRRNGYTRRLDETRLYETLKRAAGLPRDRGEAARDLETVSRQSISSDRLV